MYKLIAIWAMLILLSACGGSSSSTTTTDATSNDTIPNSFSFVDQVDVLTSSTATSLPITIDGINADTTISVTGGEYSIAEASNLPVETQSFTSEEGKIGNNDVIYVRHTTSDYANTTTDTVLIIGGVSDTFSSTTEVFTVTSSSFSNNGVIPLALACAGLGGDNESPELWWRQPPTSSKYYTIIMDDETAPCGTGDNACVHWAVYNIPYNIGEIPQGYSLSSITDIALGVTYAGNNAYDGPCPASQHTYKIEVFSLNSEMTAIPVGEANTRSQFRTKYGDKILGSALLTGTFSP